jgi:hypothetical protein
MFLEADGDPIAAGVLQVINVCLNVFDKSGNLQAGYPKSFTSFVGLPLAWVGSNWMKDTI